MGQPSRFSLIELVIVIVVVGVLAVTALPRFLPEENPVSDQSVAEEPVE